MNYELSRPSGTPPRRWRITKKILLNCFIALLLFGSFFMIANISLAADPIMTQVTGKDCSTVDCKTSPDDKCCGNLTLNDFIAIAVAISNWILAIVGSLSLLMFIYGGVMFLISSGSSERVTKAKGIIMAAVIGLIIVFASYMIIQFALKSLGVVDDNGKFINTELQKNQSDGWKTAPTSK